MVAVAVVLLVGAGLTGLATQGAWGLERRASVQALDRRTETAQWAVSAEASRYVLATQQLAAAVGARSDMTELEFDRSVVPLQAQKLAGVSGVAWIVPAQDDEVDDVQARVARGEETTSVGSRGGAGRPGPRWHLRLVSRFNASSGNQAQHWRADTQIAVRSLRIRKAGVLAPV